MGVRRGALAAAGHDRARSAFWARQARPADRPYRLQGRAGRRSGWPAWAPRSPAWPCAPDQQPSLFELAGVERRCRFAPGRPARPRPRCSSASRPRPFDLVLHMAAQPIVRAAIEEPVGTFATNVMGTAHLLRGAARTARLCRPCSWSPPTRSTPTPRPAAPSPRPTALGGKDPYSASKAAAEIVTASFAKSYFDAAGVPVATARGGNVIGGGDFSADRLVADIVRAARGRRAGRAAPSRGDAALAARAGLPGRLFRLSAGPGRPTRRAAGAEFRPAARRARGDGRRARDAGVEALGAQPWRHEPDPQLAWRPSRWPSTRSRARARSASRAGWTRRGRGADHGLVPPPGRRRQRALDLCRDADRSLRRPP